MLTIEEKIRTILRRKGKSLADIGNAVGCTRQNVSLKLRRGNWSEKELAAYAEAIGCTFEVVFTDKETGETI